MELKIKGKRALVMGSSSGLGKAIAHALIQEGAIVTICGRNEVNLNHTAQEIRAHLAIACDFDKPGSSRHLIKTISEKLGPLDILVTNTGGPPKGSFEEITQEQWLQGFHGLWLSTVEAIQAVLPGMKKQNWGRILLVTSVAAKEAMNHLTVSNGLRAGLLGLTKSMSNDLAKTGITINALLPGYTRTQRLQELGIPEEKITVQIPAGRLGEPEELAALAAFLASEQAGYITGQAIACDGGYMKSI
jgi:3-oxoacyl-[acyl-carrier protein] reductase